MKIWRSCAAPWRRSKWFWTTDLLKANYIKISFHIKVSDLCRILFSFPAPPFSPLRGKSLPPLPCCPMANALAVTGRTPPANRRIPTRFRAAPLPRFRRIPTWFRAASPPSSRRVPTWFRAPVFLFPRRIPTRFRAALSPAFDEFRLSFVHPRFPVPADFRLGFVQTSFDFLPKSERLPTKTHVRLVQIHYIWCFNHAPISNLLKLIFFSSARFQVVLSQTSA